MKSAVKALFAGLATSAALLIVGFVLAQTVLPQLAGSDSLPLWLAAFPVAWAALLLLAPSFVAGYVAKHHGAYFGLPFSLVTIALFAAMVSGTPYSMWVIFVVVSCTGGHLGQVFSSTRRQI